MKKLILALIIILSTSSLYAQEPVLTKKDTARYELEFRQLIDAQEKTVYSSMPIEIVPVEVTIKATGQKVTIKEIPGYGAKTENPFKYSDEQRDAYIEQQESAKKETKTKKK